MRCKIMRFQKLMWCNMMKSTKSQKVSILHYSIDLWVMICVYTQCILNANFHKI